MPEELPEWAGSGACMTRLACWSCMGTHPVALHWRKVTALFYRLPPEGTCPLGQTWAKAEAERAERLDKVPETMAGFVGARWDPALRRLRTLLSDEEFVTMLGELARTEALHGHEDIALEMAEMIAAKRGIDLSQAVKGP